MSVPDVAVASTANQIRRGRRLTLGALLIVGLAGCGASNSGRAAGPASPGASNASPSASSSAVSVDPDSSPSAPPPQVGVPTIVEGLLLTASGWPSIEGWSPWRDIDGGVESKEISWSCSPQGLPFPDEVLTRTVSGPGDEGQVGYVTVARYYSATAAASVQRTVQESVQSCKVKPAPWATGTFEVPGSTAAFHAEGLVRAAPDVPVEGLGFAQAEIGDAIVSVLMTQTGGPAPSQALVEATLEAAVRQAFG